MSGARLNFGFFQKFFRLKKKNFKKSQKKILPLTKLEISPIIFHWHKNRNIFLLYNNMECLKPPYNVIIYAGGKTGGSTLFQSFLKTNMKPIHIHSNKCFKESCRMNIMPFNEKYTKSIFDYIDTKEDVFIIDVYRNILDRKLSAYFQNLEHNRKYFNVPADLSIEEEVDFFHIHIMPYLENYEGIKEALDYYDASLIYKKNHWHNKKNNVNFIRLKFNNIEQWLDILKLYIPHEHMPEKLIDTNLSNNKSYYSRYKLFKQLFHERYLK